ncbi:tRNA(Ser) Um(44) 2'-O-methyltransferase [Naganishia albida]|nr:tRNA(Ser) Um(44) 2'-O-methyltransferase [Naganishia albida]
MSAKGGSEKPEASVTAQSRPRFAPTATPLGNTELSSSDEPGWINVIEAPCYFDIKVFFETLAELCLHPERNSSNILRADIVHDNHDSADPAITTATETHSANGFWEDRKYTFTAPPGFVRTRNIRRKILPRRPTRDAPLAQDCSFYRSKATEQDAEHGILVMVPHADRAEDIPYYHPVLRKLAFRYSSAVPPVDGKGCEKPEAAPETSTPDQPPVRGTISISILPFVEESDAEPVSAENGSRASTGTISGEILSSDILPNRTYRTCLHLLETLHKHGWGRLTGYQKRVVHDVIVEKTSFQDLYLILKERHKHLDSRVKKVRSNILEDLKRHVWKDVAVACFLMLLWRDMYPKRDIPKDMDYTPEIVKDKPWLAWGRPQGGFLDLGCGNGLLVHILISEGYHGRGLELRSRKTWPNYPQQTQDALVEMPINPEKWFPASLEEWRSELWAGKEDCPIVEGSFLIGNHADEMTPWIPLLSLLPSTPVPYLSLPCCLHALNAPFTLTKFVPPFEHSSAPADGFNHGLDEGESRYKTYLMWLGWSGLMCGWKWEKEGMRVPSTKGWGIIARSRWAQTSEEDATCREWAFDQVLQVRKTGGFSVREKEGNPH